VARGHLTDVPAESVYSGVVSLCSLRICIFLAELNGLQVRAANVGNAYLEAETKEKVYIIGGRGFGELEGHTLVIHKALYDLRSSGLRWHERWVSLLPRLTRKNGNIYEYIAMYVDNLAICMKDPTEVTNALRGKYGYKLKGVGPITYHLGSDYKRDPNGTFHTSAESYIDKMVKSYERTFGVTPKGFSSPLEKNNHPELYSSEELGTGEITLFQSHIGCLQWCVALGRFDIATAVMTMSRYQVSPRKGHLEQTKRMIGYLPKFKLGSIRV
jgi:hypothetical protein